MKTIREEIEKQKREKNAIILAHYYTRPEVQELADYVGDSFYLAKVAKDSEADVIVFAGVGFMGESAKLLSPEKTVLMPDLSADCAMAHMADVNVIRRMREIYSDLAVVTYINSTAELKCESDVTVTSSNAVKTVRNLPNKNIYFIPDGNLGAFVKEQVPEKNIILCEGFCPVHAAVTADELKATKSVHPSAIVLAHPECVREVRELSDFLGSTADILKYARESKEREFIIATEIGVKYALECENPGKSFYFAKENFVCPDMKLSTPENILEALKYGKNEVKLDGIDRNRAMLPLRKMLELAK